MWRAALAGALALLAPISAARAQEGAGPAHVGYFAFELGGLARPAAAVLASDGSIHVLEAARASIASFDESGAFLRRIPLGGAEALAEPAGLARGSEGRMYWSDANAARVHVLDGEGRRLSSFGKPGLAPGELHRPRGVDVLDGRVAVADEGNHRVELFDERGRHLRSIGGHGRAEGELLRPADVAFGPDGTLYVADEGNARVQVFDAEGGFVRAFGDRGPFPGLFAGPSAIEVRAGRVYVCDRANHRVQVFDLTGRALYEWGEHAILPFEGAGRLHYPRGLAVSAGGELAVVVEGIDGRAQVFVNDAARSTGERLVPRLGAGVGSAHYGEEIAAGGEWLAIAAPEDHTVLLFETSWKEPRLVAHVGELGDGAGLFLWPTGVHVDADGTSLCVTDRDRRRISFFGLGGFEGREVGYDPFLWRFVRSLDLARLFALLPEGTLAEVPEPGAVTRDGAGRIYVCDLRGDRVLELAPDLSLARVHGRRGAGPGELRRPSGLALDPARGRLYVADSGNGRVQAIELASGRFFGDEDELAWPYVAPLGEAGGELAPLLHGLAVAPDGAVFVSDAQRDRIARLSPEGRAAGGFGASGLGRLEFRGPRGIALDREGRLAIIDHANHRGALVTTAGEYAGVFGSRPFLEEARRAPEAKGEEE